MSEDGVCDRGDEDGEHDVAGEAHALGDRPGYERRRDPDEAELEEKEGGDERAVAVEEEQRRADETALTSTEDQPEAEQPEQRRRDEEVREVLDRDVDRVLRSDQAALEGGEAGLHEQHERRAEEEPADVYGLDRRHGLTVSAPSTFDSLAQAHNNNVHNQLVPSVAKDAG